MRLILGGINGEYLLDILEEAINRTDGSWQMEEVWAAVAYATNGRDTSSLIGWCFEKNVPLKFWGRLDEGVPVGIEVLNMFLKKASPRFVCKLVQKHHAKVIWWRGFGIYIGSANLTNAAWNNNVEAGCFFYENEVDSDLETDLLEMFRTLDHNASMLTEELRDLMIARNKKLKRNEVDDADFWKHPSITHWNGLARISRQKIQDRRRSEFLEEWHSTLQILRDIGTKVSLPENQPSWVEPTTSSGIQADQLLHAHYYHRTMDGRRADYERFYEENRSRSEQAQDEIIEWWKSLPAALSEEDLAINSTGPKLEVALKPDALQNMTATQFRDVAWHIHAMREYARRVPNKVVGLQTTGVRYTVPEKLDALCAYLWNQKTSNGNSLKEVLFYVLYGGPDDHLPERLWDAVSDPIWKIDRLGISSLGELVGWAKPNRFPPRNGRTSKSLRSLGYDVAVHVT